MLAVNQFSPCTVISRLIKYALRVSAQIFWHKLGFIFYCLNMSCKVICRECMIFLRLAFNVSLLTFRWNISNDRRSPSYICSASVWTSEQSNWSSMSRIMLCRASKPLKSVALCLDRLDFVAVCSPNCPKLSGWRLHWLHTAAPVPICLARLACSTLQWFHFIGLRSSGLPQVSSISRCNFTMISHRWASVKWVASSFICSVAIHQIRGSKKWYE